MLKSILDKAIGEEADIKWFGKLNYDDKEAFRRRADTDADADLIYWGYNLAKAEMRAKIPQVVDEVRKLIAQGLDHNCVYEVGVDNLLGLTVENSAQKEDKEI